MTDGKLLFCYRSGASGRGNKITLGYTNLKKQDWKIEDISTSSVGQSEPNFDKELWRKKKQLHIFSQNVSQADGEGLANVEPQIVQVLEVKKMPLIQNN